MARVEVLGLHDAIEHPDEVTHANFAVVYGGRHCGVDVVKLPEGWVVSTCGTEGGAVAEDAHVDGSFPDAALYGIGLALDQSRRGLVAR